MQASNTSHIEQLHARRDMQFSRLVSKLVKKDAAGIAAEISAMREKARRMPRRMAYEADCLRNLAAKLENHLWLLIHPEEVTPENLNHAKTYGFVIPSRL